ncbi:stalk domain-containing protein [Tepidibacillus infernus]|uniref:stalk domain-containing protein n=1 Tax=Tepidibacillus infernus TaxID=1806172 RepID=UPI003B6FB711
MKEKIVALSLVSVLALTPFTSAFAETGTGTDTGTGSSVTESGTGTETGSPVTESGTGTGISNTSETGTDTGTGSSETRFGDGMGEYTSNFSSFSFDSDLDEVTNLSQSVKTDFLSKIDIKTFLQDQQRESDLFNIGQSENHKSQIAKVQKSLQANPENESLYVELALIYLADGDQENAVQVMTELANKAPESYLTFLLRAEIAEQQGKSDEAVANLKQALENNPNSVYTRTKLGEELAASGNYNEAIGHLTIVAALNPRDENVFNKLNQVFAEAKTPGIKTFVDGVTPVFDVKPFIENGRTLVPIRAITESLEANVGWDGVKRQVSIERGNETVLLTIDSNVAIVNGQEITIDVPAKIVNGRTVLPLRFVSEAFGAKVDWKAESQMIVISE